MKKSANSQKKNVISSPKMLIIFILLICILAVVSLIVKGINLYKERGFTASSYRLLVVDSSNTAAVVSFFREPEEKVSILIIEDASDKLSGKTFFQQSLELGIPIDGVVYSPKKEIAENTGSFFSTGSLLGLVNTASYKTANFNHIDLFLCNSIYRNTPRSRIEIEQIAYTDLSDPSIHATLRNLFRDQRIVNEKITAEVVNATNVPGLASQTARIFETVGVNVISVTSADSIPAHSQVSLQAEKDVNLNLQNLLGLAPRTYSGREIYDIQIVVGEDIL